MKIKIPEKLNLLGEVFEVRFKDDADCHGEIKFDDKIIMLDAKLKKNQDKLIWVLSHELSHFFHSYYFENHFLDDQSDTSDSEMFANALANFFYSIFKQVGDEKE